MPEISYKGMGNLWPLRALSLSLIFWHLNHQQRLKTFTPLLLEDRTLIIYFYVFHQEREAGFYTTRYGRSDPMMRFKETQTRYFPDPVPEVPESKKQVSITRNQHH